MSERAANLPKTGFVIVLGLIGWIVLTGAKVRSRLGVQGSRGETMLMELRDTLTAQGELPALPAGLAGRAGDPVSRRRVLLR